MVNSNQSLYVNCRLFYLWRVVRARFSAFNDLFTKIMNLLISECDDGTALEMIEEQVRGCDPGPID